MNNNLFKISVIILSVTLFFGGCSKPLDQDSLIIRGNLAFAPNEEAPYTGKVFRLNNNNGKKVLEGRYKDGLQDGVWTFWNDDGVRIREEEYLAGQIDGLYKLWYTNGNQYLEERFVKGQRHGSHKIWYENGNLYIDGLYENGKPKGKFKVWNRDGIIIDYSNMINWISVKGGPDGDFNISATEITYEQYDIFCDLAEYQKPLADGGRGKLAVAWVTWADAVAFCNWLSIETGSSVRLPEGKEWEFAANGGENSNGSAYSGSNSIDEVAWYQDNSGNKIHEVGTKKPNELGIYDMTGNVYEWINTKGSYRGGSYRTDTKYSKTFWRSDNWPDRFKSYDLGFRVVKK